MSRYNIDVVARRYRATAGVASLNCIGRGIGHDVCRCRCAEGEESNSGKPHYEKRYGDMCEEADTDSKDLTSRKRQIGIKSGYEKRRVGMRRNEHFRRLSISLCLLFRLHRRAIRNGLGVGIDAEAEMGGSICDPVSRETCSASRWLQSERCLVHREAKCTEERHLVKCMLRASQIGCAFCAQRSE
jgi:hypothetical protein